jgi:hypothetical protein
MEIEENTRKSKFLEHDEVIELVNYAGELLHYNKTKNIDVSEVLLVLFFSQF